MTRDEIVAMARKSHLDVYGAATDRFTFVAVLERFAALVAAHEREQICAELSRMSEWTGGHGCPSTPNAYDCIKAIKARGNT